MLTDLEPPINSFKKKKKWHIFSDFQQRSCYEVTDLSFSHHCTATEDDLFHLTPVNPRFSNTKGLLGSTSIKNSARRAAPSLLFPSTKHFSEPCWDLYQFIHTMAQHTATQLRVAKAGDKYLTAEKPPSYQTELEGRHNELSPFPSSWWTVTRI